MNEKIRTLLDQCTSYYQMTNEYGDDIDIETVDQEKFAELIINECVTACEKNSWASLDAFQRSSQIKQHFGVE